MRRSITTVSAVVLGLTTIIPGVAHAAPITAKPGASAGLSPADKASLEAGVGVAPKAPYGAKPKGPNPFLAEVPDASKVDYSGWANYMKVQAKAKAAARAKAAGAEAGAKTATPAVGGDEGA